MMPCKTTRRALIVLSISLMGCISYQKANPTMHLGEANKDVVILAILAQEFLKTKETEEINLDKLLKKNPSNRILNNFEKIEQKYFGGHISVYYKFASSRNTSEIALNDKEKELLRWVRFHEKQLANQYDGEIRIAYPEKFYHIYRIHLQKK